MTYLNIDIPCQNISTNGYYRDVMVEGGFAVDAAVAGMFCNGVFTSQSTGLGGGFMMTFYQASTGKRGPIFPVSKCRAV